jgi:hypothetical protein
MSRLVGYITSPELNILESSFILLLTLPEVLPRKGFETGKERRPIRKVTSERPYSTLRASPFLLQHPEDGQLVFLRSTKPLFARHLS